MHSLGQIFKTAREAKSLTISQAAEGTRIKSQTLEWIEADLWEKMPAPLYARGFIKMYAELLEIDPVPLIEAYNTVLAGKNKKPVFVERPAPVIPPPASSRTSPPVVKKSASVLEAPPPTPGTPIAATEPPAQEVVKERNWGQASLAGIEVKASVPEIAPEKGRAPAPLPKTVPEAPRQSPEPEVKAPAMPPPETFVVHGDEAGTGMEPIDDLFIAQPRIERQQQRLRGHRDSAMLPSEMVAAFWRYVPIGLGILLVVILIFSTLKRCGHHSASESAAVSPAKVIPVSTPLKSKAVPAPGQLRLGQEPPVPYIDDQR